MADWAEEASNYKGVSSAMANKTSTSSSEPLNRTDMVQSRLKKIYNKAVLPVEKRFRYDYFYESPFLSDVEFDCKYHEYNFESATILKCNI
jgi:hypothetical protein